MDNNNKPSILMHAMIVEDDPIAIMLISNLLKENKFRVFITDSYEEAIQLYITFKPSLIILDQNLIDFKGLDLACSLRKIYNSHVTRIVLCTNDKLDKLSLDIKFKYLDNYVLKSDIDKLRSIIDHYGNEIATYQNNNCVI